MIGGFAGEVDEREVACFDDGHEGVDGLGLKLGGVGCDVDPMVDDGLDGFGLASISERRFYF